MIDPKIIEYIKYNLSQGKSREVITTTLLSQGGWSQQSVDEAFKAVESSVPTTPNYTSVVPIKYAGFWIRFLAVMVDGIILMPVNYIFVELFSLMIPSVTSFDTTQSLLVPANYLPGGVYMLAIWAYYVLMTYYKGATLGKMLMGIKVQSNNPEPLTWGRIILRETVGKMASSFILLIGYIMAAFTDKKQTLHDMMVNTVVVYKDPQKKNTTAIVVSIIIAVLIPIIAIVGIFVSIVFASLNLARNKSNDSYVRTSMTNMRTQAKIYYDKNNSSYAGVCESTLGINNLIADIELKGNKAMCYDGTSSFSVSTILKTNNSNYCTDSSGFIGEGVSTKDGICIGDRTNDGDDSAITKQENPNLTDLQKKYLVTDESGVNKNMGYFIDFNKERYYLAWSKISEDTYHLEFLKEKDNWNSFKEMLSVMYFKQDSTNWFQRYVEQLKVKNPKLIILNSGNGGPDDIVSFFVNKPDGGIEDNLQKITIIDKNTVRVIIYNKNYSLKEVQDEKVGFMADLKANAGNWLTDIAKVDFKI